MFSMACEIAVTATICDLYAVRRSLFPEWDTDAHSRRGVSGVTDRDEWEGWNWEVETTEEQESDDESWLQECVVCMSPLGDVLALARRQGRKVVFLNRKWDNCENGDVKAKFYVVSTQEVTEDEQDFVTTMLCVPLASQKRSSYGSPDWTVVILGFNLGLVKMFTADGIMLLVQCFDHDTVVNIKCRTFESPRYAAMAEQQEEFFVLHKKSAVIIQGIGLYQTLRACRNQVAKAAATGVSIFEAPPLEYKKWAFHDHELVTDCESVGIVSSSAFDQMMLDSVNKDSIFRLPRKVTSAANLFVAVGLCPYAGFHYAVEGSATPLVSEAVIAAAQKLSSYFTGFLRGAAAAPPSKQKRPPKVESATLLPSRSELRDYRRCGLNICSSPNRRLSAIVDDFGRIVLVDNYEGIVVRMWKGYRDAQCGWIEVEEDSSLSEGDVKSSSGSSWPRAALFLVIYCSRRGILEVWTSQNGSRVAAFNVGKCAILINCNHSIMGLTDVRSVLRGCARSNRCFLLDTNGLVRTITVPFHCVLSDKFSKRAHDMHLLKKLGNLIVSTEFVERDGLAAEIASVILDMKTAAVRNQALDFLSKPKAASLFSIRETVARLLSSLQSQAKDSMDFENRMLLARCTRQMQLLQLFEGVQKLRETSSVRQIDYQSVEKPLQALSVMLHLSEDEIGEFLAKVDRFLHSTRCKRCVHFQDEFLVDAGFFLSCFDNDVSHLPKDSNLPVIPVCLISKLSAEKSAALAWFLFHSVIGSNSCLPHLLGYLSDSCVDKSQLLLLLIEHWLDLDEHWSEWQWLCDLHGAVVFLSSQAMENCSVVSGYNQLSPFWCTIRKRLSQCENLAAALTAALVCRGVSMTLAAAYQRDAVEEASSIVDEDGGTAATMVQMSAEGNDKISLSDWEGVNLDTEQWSLLVKQLEDLLTITTLIHYHVPKNLLADESYTPVDLFPVAVSSLMEKGRGVISEIVSRWMMRLTMAALMHVTSPPSTVDGRDMEANDNSELAAGAVDSVKVVFEEVQRNFPYSLQWDVLLANCCWEYAVLWNKDKEATQALCACVACLQAVVGSPWSKGLSLLLWDTFMRKPFMATAKLVEKVGKSPKGRLCWKDVGMSDSSLEKFIGCCVELFDVFTRCGAVRDAQQCLLFRCEDPWHDSAGPAPLVDHAAARKDVNYLLVCHHHNLAVVLHSILTFSLKCKPLSLYDSQSRALFFIDLCLNASFPTDNPGLAIINSRKQFLCRAVSAIVQTIPEPLSTDVGSLSLSSDVVSRLSANSWMCRVLDVATEWQLDCDYVRRHYICELYSSGLDALAEEMLPSVSDCEVMGSQLILIAGQRVYNAIHKSDDTFVKTKVHFPPMVTTWLETLSKENLRCPCPPLATIASMITYVLNVIPDHQAEYKMAMNLLEALEQLICSELEENVKALPFPSSG